jgi:hypothetical protein
MGSALMLKTPKYSAFAIAAIESIWPNDDGTEADLDLLDLSYISGFRDAINKIEPLNSIFVDGEVFNQDRFVYQVINFFFNPGGLNLYDLGINSVGLGEKLKNNNYDIIALLNQLGSSLQNYPFLRWVSADFDPANKNSAKISYITKSPATFKDLSPAESLAASYVIEIIKPTGLSYRNYVDIANFLKTFKPDKGIMSYSDPFPGISLRQVLISRASELARIALRNESLTINNSRNNRLNLDSNGLYPVSIKRPDYNNYLKNSADAFKKRRGYFKIIPLNIIQASSSFTTSGEELGSSKFQISFTMDDVIVVADKYAESQIKNIPTALPISLNSGEITSILRGIDLNSIQNSEEISTLGLSAYRISGANFPFNIEDLVEANDTVTIWFYHDPSEFDFVPSAGGGSQKEMLDAFIFNKDFSYVIGNASRKSENESNLIGREINANQRILTGAGVLNPYTSPLNRPEFLDEVNSYSPIASFSQLDSLNVLRSAGNFLSLSQVNQALSPIGNFSSADFNNVAASGIEVLSNSFFPGANQGLIRTSFAEILKSLYLSEAGGVEGDARARNAVSLVNSFEDILNSHGEKTVEEQSRAWLQKYGNTRLPGSTLTYSSVISSAEEVFTTLNNLKNPLRDVTNSVLGILQENNVVNVVNPEVPENSISGFFNKRKYVATSSHGETPYLAIKGHIDAVQVAYGSGGAVNKVTISGAGYEKILKQNRVYYEDLFYPSTGTSFNLIEVQAIYLEMLPPNAILHFIATHAPKFIMFGTGTQATRDMKNAAIRTIAQYPTLKEAESLRKAQELELQSTGEVSGLITVDALKPVEETDFEDYEVVEFIRDLYKNNKVLARGQVAIDANDVNSSESSSNKSVLFRFFYPINYINTTRMQEMVKLLLRSYEDNPSNANIKSPINISTSASIANNVAAMNGDSSINQLFIDETGRLRQRITFEAWERTPNPVYTPTITDREVLSGEASFSRDGEQVLTMVDIRPYFGGTQFGDVRFAGRALADGNDYIPVLMTSEGKSLKDADNISADLEVQATGEFRRTSSQSGSADDVTTTLLQKNFYETLSEPFFRYGKRYKNITRDIYAQDTSAAKRKAILLQRFFEKPVKEAKISTLGNTSYRAGETVLVSLQNYKHRSSEIVDIKKTLDWLRYLQGDAKLRDLYIGIDERFLNDDAYYLTNGILKNRQELFWLKNYNKEFILSKFIETFQYLNDILAVSINRGPKYITPEFFPTTLWAFRNQSFEIANKFGKNLTNTDISQFYARIYNSLINGENSEIGEFLSNHPEAINAIRFQNFRATSYYINSVSHTFVHGTTMTTQLNLTHGQDNLVLLEPFTMRPIGFISIERRLKMGYDDVVIDQEGNPVYKNPNKQAKERTLWEEFDSKKKSALQLMYEEQFFQDKAFKESSFLYSSQKNRNSSNFMYELSLDLGLQ